MRKLGATPDSNLARGIRSSGTPSVVSEYREAVPPDGNLARGIRGSGTPSVVSEYREAVPPDSNLARGIRGSETPSGISERSTQDPVCNLGGFLRSLDCAAPFFTLCVKYRRSSALQTDLMLEQ